VREPLPIDPFLDEIVAATRTRRAAVVTAPPGSGKTTRVPPAAAVDGAVILLQPRRVAARAIARRIADEQEWTLGVDVGWHIRFDRQFGPKTRVLVVTEGILTARLQQDPLLSAFRTVVLDEFHERSVHADLGLALARQAWLARDDLALLVMSATLDATRVSAFLGDCPVVAIPARAHPVDVQYMPGQPVALAIRDVVDATSDRVLVFLPGAPEIRRVEADLRAPAGLPDGVDVVPLHGSLDASAQDRALEETEARRVILATNIAETSLTVPGVTAVVDTGLHKVARYDPGRAIDSLDTERITADAADQRAGRAGRTRPGLARRLWDARDRLRPHREPDIARIDLAGPILDVLAWGGDPRSLEWFEPPASDRLESALALLVRLGAVTGWPALAPVLTSHGRALQRLPLHPRLGRILIEAGGAHEAAVACAVLSERHFLPPRQETTSCDLLMAIDVSGSLPFHVRRVAEDVERLASAILAGGRHRHVTEPELRRALLAGYPDRVGRRRAPGSPRVLMASGHGAMVAPESGVRDGEFLVALDVMAGRRGTVNEARIRLASRVERDWLPSTCTEHTHWFDSGTGEVHATLVERYEAVPLRERTTEIDPSNAANLLSRAYLDRGPNKGDRRLLRRLAFAGRPVDLESLVRKACQGVRRLADVHLERHLPATWIADLERLAPDRLAVPSGRGVRLEYRDDGTVLASVKLQELFGLAETPHVGPRREPVVFELLAPNGRPVQVTRDLRSFWERGYPDVRRELRGRYPKHPWPEDPWTALPTASTSRRRVR